jgi:hypothetical protein
MTIPRIMLDLETLSSRPNAAVVSIGAVAFDPKAGLGQEFYTVLRTEEQVRELGRDIDPGTFAWWCKQGDEARKVFSAEAAPVDLALNRFIWFVGQVAGEQAPEIWGYGADFDCVVLGGLYEAAGTARPWKYNGNRCYRTLAMLVRGLAELPARSGTHHNALDDARYQAECAIVALNRLGVR